MECIGLFGTCGSSKWRETFIAEFTRLGIPFYNPQVENWEPKNAAEEARHLAEDSIILFPVTGETYDLGSLAETGFSITQAIRTNSHREVIVLIDETLDETLTDEALAKESLRARQLVKAHINELNLPNVYLVDTLEQLLKLSLALFDLGRLKKKLVSGILGLN